MSICIRIAIHSFFFNQNIQKHYKKKVNFLFNKIKTQILKKNYSVSENHRIIIKQGSENSIFFFCYVKII